MKRILVERGEVGRIARMNKCTPQAVRNALRGYVEGELCERIRKEALRAGGVEKPKRRVVRVPQEMVSGTVNEPVL
jgi:hypothetical protein